MAKQPQRSTAADSATQAVPKSRSSGAARPRTDRNVVEQMPELDAGNQSESMSSEPSEEDIRMRAYHRYLERGGGHGMDFEDWLEAERELKSQAPAKRES
jgi:hypothetical protein